MIQAVFRKLDLFVRLSDEERDRLAAVLRKRVRRVGPRQDISMEGLPARNAIFMLRGWACRYKHLSDGRRQTMAYLLPGDACDLAVFGLPVLDHSLATIGPAQLAEVPRREILDLLDRCPGLARGFAMARVAAEAIGREWLVNLGQRSAAEKLAHLFCELSLRATSIGLCVDGRCPLPLTQIDLASATGMSIVHINRTLQELRASGLVRVESRQLHIVDPAGLRDIAQFDNTYLHVGRMEGQRMPEGTGRALQQAAAF
jgi:CRP-like cAMP-binding protein